MDLSIKNSQKSSEEAFNELSFYSLSNKTEEFIHQYAVDAYAAQTAEKTDKPIKIAFALIGLYLHIEKNFTGKMVQKAHMLLARYKNQLPTFTLPEDRGEITVFDVLKTPEGPLRDKEIEKWMVSVWQAFRQSRTKIIDFLAKHKEIIL